MNVQVNAFIMCTSVMLALGSEHFYHASVFASQMRLEVIGTIQYSVGLIARGRGEGSGSVCFVWREHTKSVQ